MAGIFVTPWVGEYLSTGKTEMVKAKKEDVVLIADPTTPMGSWMLGRVIDTTELFVV